jgi:hypothetical protein
MVELVDAIPSFSFNINGNHFGLVLFLTLDWVGLCMEIGITEPKHAKNNEVGCGFCGELMGTFRGDWWSDPFKRYSTTQQINNYPKALFPNLPLTNCRYCAMHGVNACLSNAINELISLIPSNSPLRTTYRQLITSISPKWYPKRNFECVETKAFFHRKMQDQLIDLFREIRGIYDLPWPNRSQRVKLPLWKVVALLLDSLRVYKDFAYTEWPTAADFEALESARVGLLAVWAGMKWRMKPTIHYMTNEGVAFAHLDGTMYHTLNEAPENEHKEVKQMASNSMKNIATVQTNDNCFQQVLNHQSMMRELRKRGYAPPEWALVPIDPAAPLPPSTSVPPLKYLPD